MITEPTAGPSTHLAANIEAEGYATRVGRAGGAITCQFVSPPSCPLERRSGSFASTVDYASDRDPTCLSECWPRIRAIFLHDLIPDIQGEEGSLNLEVNGADHAGVTRTMRDTTCHAIVAYYWVPYRAVAEIVDQFARNGQTSKNWHRSGVLRRGSCSAAVSKLP